MIISLEWLVITFFLFDVALYLENATYHLKCQLSCDDVFLCKVAVDERKETIFQIWYYQFHLCMVVFYIPFHASLSLLQYAWIAEITAIFNV